MTAGKKLFATVLFLFASAAAFACEVCQKQQPKVLRGISHGGGPNSDWDYAAVWCMVIIVVISAVFSIKWMFRPGEKDGGHIKRSILNLD